MENKEFNSHYVFFNLLKSDCMGTFLESFQGPLKVDFASEKTFMEAQSSTRPTYFLSVWKAAACLKISKTPRL